METYEELRRQQPDFIVSYRLYSPSEGGRRVTYQHLRCDFLYEGEHPGCDGPYMIHPEFLDESGRPICEGVVVPLTGRASMWILVPEMRARVHRSKVGVGVRGHFMEGRRKIGDVVIEEIVGLHFNPSE